MDTLFWVTGLTVIVVILLVVLYVIIIGLWCYLAVSFTYWIVHIMAIKKYPKGGAVKDKYMVKRFWRIRLLLLVISDWEMIFALWGRKSSGETWFVDYTNEIPKFGLIEQTQKKSKLSS